jgi:hypothetical protein
MAVLAVNGRFLAHFGVGKDSKGKNDYPNSHVIDVLDD